MLETRKNICSNGPMPVPQNYDELKEAIGRAYPDMSKQLQRIARFALEQPDPLALDTVAAIAKAAHVQPSSMIRFANALGYSGFTEMQQVFRGHLVARSATVSRANRGDAPQPHRRWRRGERRAPSVRQRVDRRAGPSGRSGGGVPVPRCGPPARGRAPDPRHRPAPGVSPWRSISRTR
jgi:hypothetical protein